MIQGDARSEDHGSYGIRIVFWGLGTYRTKHGLHMYRSSVILGVTAKRAPNPT